MPISIEVTLYVNREGSDRMNSNIRFNGEAENVAEAKAIALDLHRLSELIGSTQAPAPAERPKVTAAEVSAERDANGGTMMDAKERVIKAKQEVPNAKPKSEDTSSTSQSSAPESAPVTYDDVKRATNAVSKISRDKAIAGLARFGVQSATKLTEAQWPEYVTYMTRVAAGEIDPEAAHA